MQRLSVILSPWMDDEKLNRSNTIIELAGN